MLQIAYCQKNKCFAYIDYESNLGYWGKDFSEAPVVTHKVASQSVVAPVTAADIMEQDDDAVDEIPDNFLSQEQQGKPLSQQSIKEEVKSQISKPAEVIKSQSSVVA